MNIKDKLELLRKVMSSEGLHAWIVPSADPHASEYVSARWMGRKWLSGFTGSAGTLVVLKNKAGLWTDGRYHIQAEHELKDSGIDLFREGLADTINLVDWVYKELADGNKVGFDGEVFSCNFKNELIAKYEQKNISVLNSKDLLEQVWPDRPSVPANPVYELPLKYAGKSRPEKLSEVRQLMREQGVTHHFISSLDDIAWLFNFRGDDIESCPVALSYALVSMDSAQLFIDTNKIPENLKLHFQTDNIELVAYADVDHAIENLPAEAKILFDHNRVNSRLADLVPPNCKKVDSLAITSRLKAVKNQTEIEHFRNCHIKDGAAVVKFLKWLDDNVASGQVTEISASAQLQSYREEIETFKGLSFTTIPGYGANGAKMHYAVSPESNQLISDDDFFLVDSGGQYFDGTTDITRTMCYGELSDLKKHDFTLVLKGHIQLALAKFMAGTRGLQLDMLARQPLWKHAINYACGTGHGVGFFLNVHEGPHSISLRFIDEALEPGMCVTNEPGIYRKNQHGIRIENIMLVVADTENEFGSFYSFEQLTMCPIDTKALQIEMLSREEKDYLNNYHREVYTKLSPLLNKDEVKWLRLATREI